MMSIFLHEMNMSYNGMIQEDVRTLMVVDEGLTRIWLR
jgi:hypothetical protein